MAMSTERKAERKTQREYDKRMNALTPIADAFKPMGDSEIIEGHIDGVKLSGNVALVNVALEKMGYRPVRITRNMLNDKSARFCIDINTPSYMDPGCESYHSM